jgi:hypothetical protein
MRSIAGVGESEGATIAHRAARDPILPHPDRFAVFPPHEGEGGSNFELTVRVSQTSV